MTGDPNTLRSPNIFIKSKKEIYMYVFCLSLRPSGSSMRQREATTLACRKAILASFPLKMDGALISEFHTLGASGSPSEHKEKSRL